MKRRIFTLLSAGSLLLCVAMVVLWVVSYSRGVRIGHTFPADARKMAQSYAVVCVAGGMWVDRGKVVRSFLDRPIGWEFDAWPRNPELEPWTSGLWFAYEATISLGWDHLCIPLWLPTILTLIAPAVWARRFREHRRRQRLGLCLQCAYDLRASHDKCPECGAAIPADLVRKAIK